MSPHSISGASRIAYLQSDGQSKGGAPTTTGADLSPAEETAEPTELATPSVTETSTPTVTAEPTPSPTTVIGTPQPFGVVLPHFPDSIPGVSVNYYTISGSSEDDLISAMLAKGPTVCGIADAAACFSSTFSWNDQVEWKYQAGTELSAGVCSVTSVNFTATYTINLPQWTGPSRVPAALVAWWKLVFDHIVWHESQHLAIAESYVPKFEQAILGGPCDQPGQGEETSALSAQLEAAQNAFDVQQQSWTWPPY